MSPHEHVTSPKAYFTVYFALLALLVLTVGAAFVNFEPFNLAFAMVIAVTKAVLIVLVFMHVRHGPPLVGVFAGSGFFFLAILLALSLSDYFTRGWMHIPGK